MKKYGSLLLGLLLMVDIVNAQDFLGYNYSNYQTAGGMVFNPASIANSRYKVNVNLFSLNAGAVSNSYEFRKNSIFEGNSMVEGLDFFKIDDAAKKSLFFNVDILGPSFMIDISPKIGAFGISSRVRFLTNERNLNNDLFQLFGDANANYFGVPYTQDNLMMDAHGFADIGLTYARVILQNERHVIKGGFTGKYVVGISGGSLRIDNLNVQVDEELSTDMIKSLQGNMTMLYSAGLDRMVENSGFEDIWDNVETGGNFGMDIGVEYEWYRNGNRTSVADLLSWRRNSRTPYTLKVSVSVTDIGKVKYAASQNTSHYTLNTPQDFFPLSDLNLDGKSLDEYFDYLQERGIITASNLPGDYKVSLPTTLRMNVDANVFKRFFVNAGANISLLGTNSYGSRYCDYYYVTPRYESKWLSVYSPVSYNSLKQVNWGIGLNAGVFFIGSGSVLSNLLSDTVKGIDIHIGLNIPLFKRVPRTSGVIEL